MGLKSFIGGVHPYEGKEFAENAPIKEVLPEGELIYPVSQHIGAPATPIVAVGDTVLKGQKIADIINDVAVLIIGVFILYFGWKLMWKSTNKYTGVLKICYFWIDLGLVLGFASMIFLIVLKYIPRKKKKEVVA